MSDELRIKIVLDSGEVKEGFLAVEKQADTTAKKVGQSFDKKGDGLNKLTDGINAVNGGLSSIAGYAASALGPVGAFTLSMSAAAAAVIKMSLAGEQVNAVNSQFKNIAASAGLSAEKFGDSIVKATQGLIDDEDALQIATKGIVALGDQAAKLPAILDASRGVSRALGKDFKSTFEDLSTFVEVGNARVLRQFGIILDLDKAYEKAAKSIGLTAAQLNEQQKQQIRANLILDEVPKKFNAAAQSVTPLKDALDRLKVSAGNAFEDMTVKLNGSLGPALVRIATYFDNVAKSGLSASDVFQFLSNPLATIAKNTLGATGAATGLDKTALSLSDLKERAASAQDELAKINTIIEILRESKSTASGTAISAIDAQIESVTLKSKTASKNVAELFSLISAKSGAEDLSTVLPSNGGGGRSEKLKVSPEQLKILKQQEEDFTAFLLGEQLKRQTALQQFDEIKISELKDGQNKVNQEILLNQDKLTTNETQHQINLLNIKKQYAGESALETQKRNLAIQAEEENNRQQIVLIREKGVADVKKLADAANQAITEAAKGISTAIGQGFISTVSGSLQRLGASLVKGGAAFSDFGDFVLNILGDLAIQVGTLLLAFGAGVNKLAVSLASFNGAAAIAAGVALIVIGGAIKALAKGGGSTAPAGGGGVAASPSSNTELTPQENLTRQEAGTSVSVVIQGDVLDSDESGSRVVSLINQAFDKKGVVINQGVFA